MKAIWKIDTEVLENIRLIVNKNITSEIVEERKLRNIKKQDIDLSKDNIWKILIGCQITTQQKSGKGSVTSKFMESKSDLLDYALCENKNANFFEKELIKGSLRRNKNISEWLYQTKEELKNGEWNILINHLESLKKAHSINEEREVVNYLRNGNYKGLGLKQSRNFLQWLGLTEYVVPIDSRVCKALKNCGCTFVPGYSGLQDECTYEFFEDGLQIVSEKLGIMPCILDACLFGSFDSEK